MATAPPKKTRDLLDQQQAPYQQRFHVTTVTRYLMVSVTSTLHFRDTLHFTITTTTTTTMTTATTKPPRPPPRAQTRPPPLQEQTGLETQLRLESQVYFFRFFVLFFFALLTFIYSVYGMRATTTTTDGHHHQHTRAQTTVYRCLAHRLLLLLLLCKLTNLFLLDTTIFFPNTPRPPRAVTRAQTTVNPPRRV